MKKLLSSITIAICVLVLGFIPAGCDQAQEVQIPEERELAEAAEQLDTETIQEQKQVEKPKEQVTGDSLVATVDGEPIVLRELKQRLMRNRAMIYSHFNQKYGVRDSRDFWTTGHGGEVPIEMIKKKSLAEAIRIKIEQIIAKQNGVIDDISYGTFLERRVKENKRRKIAVAKKQVIYGPIQYTEQVYFSYIFSNMVIRSKEKLGLGQFNLDTEQLQKIYEAEKDETYKRRDEVKVEIISVPFARGKSKDAGISKNIAKAKIEEVKAKLDKGESFEKLAESYNKSGQVEEFVLDEDSERSDDASNPRLMSEAKKLSVGQLSAIFEEENAFYIIKCVERKDMGYMPFDEMRGIVKSRYVDEKYKEMVDKMIAQAEIEINKDVYSQIRMRQ